MADVALPAGMRWSGISVIGREICRTLFTILLARLVGPEDFGIVAQGMVYIAIVGLLLDQGFSSALIQRARIDSNLPGAIVTVNLAAGGALAVLTVAIAPIWADFMNTPELVYVLAALAPALLIRAAAITPRAMLIRDMKFKQIGIADIASALAGGALGLSVALAGGGYWAIVAQILGTDVAMLFVIVAMGAARWPNLQFRLLREIFGFSGRAFAAGLLINSVSRNIDNLLVARFQGPEALAFYGLAYRLLLAPVQLASNTVGAVLFPAFSRLCDDLPALRRETDRATRALASLALPAMALVAAAAPQLVHVVFGLEWEPAVPIVQVLAIAGAFQAVFQPAMTPLVLGLGRDVLNLRYAWLTTVATTIGIVAGLPFGPLGVAVGYTIATTLLIPVDWLIRRHLLAMGLKDQVKCLVPGAHIAAWMAATYLLVALAVTGHDLIVLGVGTLVAAAVGITVAFILHRSQLAELAHMARSIVGRPAARRAGG